MANMNFVPINAVFLLFVSIATLYIEPILGTVRPRQKCWQGIHGQVPGELATTLLKDDSITVNDDMVKVHCLKKKKNPCLTFTCTGGQHNNYIFNGCAEDDRREHFRVCSWMVQYCDNGRDIACYTCRNELCNNMSLAADSRTSNQPIPIRAPDKIYFQSNQLVLLASAWLWPF